MNARLQRDHFGGGAHDGKLLDLIGADDVFTEGLVDLHGRAFRLDNHLPQFQRRFLEPEINFRGHVGLHPNVRLGLGLISDQGRLNGIKPRIGAQDHVEPLRIGRGPDVQALDDYVGAGQRFALLVQDLSNDLSGRAGPGASA